MANRLTAQQLEQERVETLQKLTGNYPLPIDRPAIIYSRYSQERQVRNSIASGLEQSEKLLQRADDLGWNRELLTLLIENQMTKDGRIRSVSGTIPIDDRAGMSTTMEYVKGESVGAILCDDISRLTRDADLVDAMTLAKDCKTHGVIIVTSERVYDFRRKSDFDSYIDEARAAASWIDTHIKGKMLKNRTRKAQQGKSGNGVAPVGLRVTGDRNSDLIPSPHAERVNWLFGRYRAHNASLSGLLNELTAMARAGNPVFPVHPDIDPRSIFLTQVHNATGELIGWTVASRFGLRHILTNPQYQGHLVFNRRVIKRNVFPAIVDLANWQWAQDHLASLDLDGNPIEHEKKTVRYKQEKTEDKGALLVGTRHDGRPVIDGLNGSHVYYKSNTERYILRKVEGIGGYEAAISGATLDKLFSEHMRKALILSEFADNIYNRTGERGVNLFRVKPELHELAYAVEGSESQEEEKDTTLETLNEQLEEVARHIRIGAKLMTDKELEAAYEKQYRLRQRKTKYEESQRQEALQEAEMRQAEEDIKYASQLWDKWGIEHKRRCIRLATQSITLEEVSVGWLRLTVKWSPVLGGVIEQCYIWQASGETWKPEELDTLRVHYPVASRKELLHLLPTRTWHAVENRANEEGLKRSVVDSGTVKKVDISVSDRAVIERYHLAGVMYDKFQWVFSPESNELYRL